MSLVQVKKALAAFQGKRVLVLGDMVLDEYVRGTTERVSREAPVLILRHESTQALPGGGANPASNIHSLGGISLPLGVIGDDMAGAELERIFRAKGLDTSGLLRVPGRVTARKVRVLAGSINTARQQVIRVDYANDEGLSPELQRRLIGLLDARLARADALIVSDYGQVVGLELLKYVNSLKKRHPKLVTCVDSRYQLDKYRNVTVITPNEAEAAPAAGFDDYHEGDLPKIGATLLKRTSAKMVLVTRGSKGMSLFQGGQRPQRLDLPVYGSKQIIDVNGAGDSVAAAMTLGLAAGAAPATAMALANAAGGVAVMQAGPASVMREQIWNLIKKSIRS